MKILICVRGSDGAPCMTQSTAGTENIFLPF
jgi:hypothetical protein